MTVELALTPDGRWDIGLADLVAATHDAGFTGLALGLKRADAEGLATLQAGGLRCHELTALTISRNEEKTLERAGQLAAAVAEVRAPWVLTTYGVPLTEASAALIARCAAMLAEAGAGMAVEFSPLGPVATLDDGLAVVEAAGRDRAGLMIDSWHFCHGSPWDQLEQVPLERIAYVQFDDALAPISDDGTDETMNRRTFPGDGVLDLHRFAGTLLERGWDGVVSVEVLSAALNQLPIPEYVQRAYATTAAYWR